MRQLKSELLKINKIQTEISYFFIINSYKKFFHDYHLDSKLLWSYKQVLQAVKLAYNTQYKGVY
ncbi:hypothetical protein AB204_12745 [Xenorhabdus khoisanae]|uniref:Uncharacterized protein n=1 Tax=Xenorhabdus khoisanae TaxID=880157 RepID=A0A0J5FS16_9GAMM|nr:hypothetical protein AB204_12745 [Xenorhabdus khoisanae]